MNNTNTITSRDELQREYWGCIQKANILAGKIPTMPYGPELSAMLMENIEIGKRLAELRTMLGIEL